MTTLALHSRYYKNATGEAYRENNDCAVVAIATTCCKEYETARSTLATLGRVKNKGTNIIQIVGAVRKLGHELRQMHSGFKVGVTASRIGAELGDGVYLAFTSTHVLSVVNGTVLDWTQGRRHRIKQVYKVILDESKITVPAQVQPGVLVADCAKVVAEPTAVLTPTPAPTVAPAQPKKRVQQERRGQCQHIREVAERAWEVLMDGDCDGQWSKENKKLHKQLVTEYLEECIYDKTTISCQIWHWAKSKFN